MASSGLSQCGCGKVTLRWRDPTPHLMLECCCCDCRQAHEFEAAQGGPPMLSPVSELLYFKNENITLDAAQNQDVTKYVRSVQLREGARSTRLVTTCCHSILAVDHPAYMGNLFMVPIGSQGKLEYSEVEHDDGTCFPTPAMRIYLADWDTVCDGPAPEPMLDPNPALWHGMAPGDIRGVFASCRACGRREAPNGEHIPMDGAMYEAGATLQEIFQALGPPTILGLVERERFRPGSLVQRTVCG